MSSHIDLLKRIDQHIPLKEKLPSIHRILQKDVAFIDYVSVVIYDEKTCFLKTFLHSGGNDEVLKNYSILIDDTCTLKKLQTTGLSSVINDVKLLDYSVQQCFHRMLSADYAAIYADGRVAAEHHGFTRG